MPINIIAEHADFFIVNKPVGIGMHTEGDVLGLVVLVSQQLGHKLYPVHRLDKVTSGLVILARSSQAAAEFGRLFEQKRVSKAYLALSVDKPRKKQGWIKGDMDRARRGAWRLLRTCINPAMTRFTSQLLQPGLRLFLLRPLTGKTHQLRVAMKSLGAPIVGDQLYGATKRDRTYLHAYWLAFEWLQQSFEFETLPEGELWPRDWPELTVLRNGCFG